MNAIQQARQAYAAPQAATRTPRQAERQVLSNITAGLNAAAADPADFPRLVAAVSLNRRLWTRLAADVAGAGNGLPQALRAQLFYLAEFTAHHTRRVLKGEADVQPLIDVNTAVMRGLAGQPPGPAPVSP